MNNPLTPILPMLYNIYDKCNSFNKHIFADIVNHYLTKPNEDIMESLAKYFGFLSSEEILAIPNLITPMVDKKIKDVKMSYGMEPYGYTLRLGKECIIDDDKKIEIPTIIKPLEAILVSTLETVEFPHNCIAILHGKTSYLRQWILYSFGGNEPGYKGTLSFPIFNAGKKSVELFPEQGICQIQFFRCTNEVQTVYEGRYQDSKGVQGVKFV